MPPAEVQLLSIPKIPDERGNISFLQNPDQIPFKIGQVYWINDIPSGSHREGRANENHHELIIALSGSFDVVVTENGKEQRYPLNRPDICVHVPRGVWRQLVNFSTNSVVFVITDEEEGGEQGIGTMADTGPQANVPRQFKIFDCNIIYLPGAKSLNGSVTPVAALRDLPFGIERVYYLYDIPGGASRGGHAHKKLQQFVVAISGSFDITVDDGINKKTVQLNRSSFGLHIRPGIWREVSNFSSGAICLAIASGNYDEEDYIREYDEFKKYALINA